MDTTFRTNHWVKKAITAFFLLILMFSFVDSTLALGRSGAIEEYRDGLLMSGAYQTNEVEKANQKAEEDVDALIASMEGGQVEASETVAELEKRISAININDPKKDKANNLWKKAKKATDSLLEDSDFSDYNASKHLEVIRGPGTLPRVMPDSTFEEAEEKSLEAINAVNRYLISPSRPGNVPEGDLIEDFIPQLIRQLFRFAWLVIFISLVASGVMFVMAFDNDERITKAKHMIYYTLIGFAVVSLAFAVVKAVTDIDFFAFI